MPINIKSRFINPDIRNSIGLLLFIFILFFPAFLINLGLSPFILDEATRANVAMEMVFNGNFIVPTINGEFYYNKPPLFNWILILFTKITGNYSEFSFRIPVVISIFLFAWTIYMTMKKDIGRAAALLTALAFLTCGRILFYDSLKGLIDISFSWIIYLIFWTVIHYHRRKEYYSLFIITWILTSLAFLMKGLPALVFQGISLLAFFIMKRDVRKLFSLPHFLGIFVFIVLVGSYFLAYNSYNPLINYVDALWSESTKRTFLENSLFMSVKHFFTFPFEFIYHFLPWALFILVLFRKGAFRWLLKEEFTSALMVLFGANILVYWFSPAIYARYLFMFLPLLFGTVFHAWVNYKSDINLKLRSFIRIAVLVAMAMIVLLILFFPLFVDTAIFPHFLLKYVIVLILLIPVAYFSFSLKIEWPFVLVSFLLVSRIAFNFFVVPHRISTGTDEYQKRGAIVAAGLSRGKELFLFENTRIQNVSTYYISREREKVLTRWEGKPLKGVLYIVEEEQIPSLQECNKIFSFETRLDELKLSLVEF